MRPNGVKRRTLADLDPDAKVILTVRDPKDWYKSMTRAILSGLSAANDSKNGGPSSELRAMAKPKRYKYLRITTRRSPINCLDNAYWYMK